MTLFTKRRSYFAGTLLLGLVGCLGGSQPQASAPDVQPTAEIPVPESAPDVQPTVEAPMPGPAPDGEIATADIWLRLQQADTHYYVFMRHAIAPGTGDPANFQLDDCSTQRNLSEEGRAQARRTGDAFREKDIAIQQVLSSEWCRCLDTAELLALAPVERFPALNSFFQDRAKGPEQTQQLREFMVNNQDEPGVTILVTHFVNITAIANSNVSSGEMVVMQINDQNEPEVVEQIEQL
ncbi:MAG: histidine phosphatase family protein [Cyanobacteria bacterium P01_H01_bin.21]